MDQRGAAIVAFAVALFALGFVGINAENCKKELGVSVLSKDQIVECTSEAWDKGVQDWSTLNK